MWLIGSLALLGWHAQRADSALNAATAQITAGDPIASRLHIETARSSTRALQDDINTAYLGF